MWLLLISWSRHKSIAWSKHTLISWSRHKLVLFGSFQRSYWVLKASSTLIAQLDYTCLWIDLTPPIVLCPCWFDWLDFQQLAPSPWHLCSQGKFCLYIIEIRSLYRSLVLYSRVGTYLASYWSLTNSSAVLCLSLRVNRLRIRGIILTTIIVVGQPVQCRGQSLTSQAYAHFTDWKLLLKYIILFHQKLQLHDTKTLKM